MRKLLALISLLFLSCTTEPAPETEPVSEPPPPRTLVAATDGGLAIVDASTGTIMSTFRSDAKIDHLVIDPFRHRLLTFETDDRDEGGRTVARDLAQLDHPEELAFLDGSARFQPAPLGVIVFEESYGTRWRLLGSPRGAPAPMPSAAWLSDGVVQTLALGDEGLSARSVAVGPKELSIEQSTVDPRSPYARGLALGFQSIADARALDDERIVLLVDGPPRVVVASDVVEATLALADDVRTDLTRGLVVMDAGYVLVGTARSLHALRVLRTPTIGGCAGSTPALSPCESIAIESVFVAPSVHAPIDGPL